LPRNSEKCWTGDKTASRLPCGMTVLPGIGHEAPGGLEDPDGCSGDAVELPADYPAIREYLLDTLRTR
ncbi:MAG TPA: hypothetical protein PLO86_12560, partial [Syntrophales bacterium]|nr:hypothetical protein [Syntrophales bacterium]